MGLILVRQFRSLSTPPAWALAPGRLPIIVFIAVIVATPATAMTDGMTLADHFDYHRVKNGDGLTTNVTGSSHDAFSSG